MREISLAILDIAQNSIDAGATLLEIEVLCNSEKIVFTVLDNGRGMSETELESATERGVSFKGSSGLGLALLKNEVLSANGRFEILSKQGVGTKVEAEYDLSARLGSLGDTFVALVDEGYDTVLTLNIFGRSSKYDTRELKSSADVAQLQASGVLRLIREDINEKTNGGAML